MTFIMILKTLFEIFLFAAVIYAAFNEDRLAAFEKRIIATIRRKRLKVVKPSANTVKASF